MASAVYFLRTIGEPAAVKIGYSRLPTDRLIAYRQWCPIPLELVAQVPGGEQLEARFHAGFAHLHIHGEWFRAAPDLDAAIAAVQAGAFDTSTLPAGRRLRTKTMKPEAIQATLMSRRLGQLANVISIPKDVGDAASTYGRPPEEVARCRAIVREFVLAHAHLHEAAKVATREVVAQRRAEFEAWQAKLKAA